MTDYTLLGSLTGPSSNDGDPTQINLAMLFKVTSQAWLKALRFWRADTGITGSPFGELFTYTDESSGTAVAGTSATFTLSGTGWQQANITPVALTVGQLYKVVVNFPDFYNGTGAFWSTGTGVGGIVSGPLTAPDAGGNPLGLGAIKQGTFLTGSSLAYPTSYFNGANYWVDVLVTNVDPNSTPSSSDSAALSETQALTGFPAGTDTATLADSASISAVLAATDSAAVADTISALTATTAVTDAAALAETAVLLASPGGADTGHLTETQTVTVGSAVPWPARATTVTVQVPAQATAVTLG